MTKPIDVSVAFRLSGHFRLMVSGGARGRQVLAEFDNLILNQGLDRVAQGAWISYCQVGTGNTAPNVAQTGLVSLIAGSNTAGVADVDTYVAGGTPYHQLVRTRRFSTGVATGTLAEVGMGWAASGATLFSRALILDSGGSPTTITVLADETLDVEYTLRIYPPAADVTGTKTISGVDYGFVLRASGVGGLAWQVSLLVGGAVCSNSAPAANQAYPSTSVLGAVTGEPSGSSVAATGVSASTYVLGAYSRDVTVVWGLTSSPSGGVKCVSVRFGPSSANGQGAVAQMSFDPVVPKTGANVLTLVLSITWARL